jgi:hypothetical protein
MSWVCEIRQPFSETDIDSLRDTDFAAQVFDCAA